MVSGEAGEAESDVAQVTVIGAGAIGLGMAAVFADAGFAVDIIEPDEKRRSAIPDGVAKQLPDMKLAGLARSSRQAIVRAVSAHQSLAGARPDPQIVIEAGPEKLDVKRRIFAELREWTGGGIPLATTSSAMTVSAIVKRPDDRAWTLCAHCVNPPSILRVIECAPARETLPEAVDHAVAVLAKAGFTAVPLGREIAGFVVNRLQSTILREAYRLVAAGVIDAPGLDRLVSEALGPRWALSGPFETVELNTPGGIKAHAARMGPAYKAIGEEIGERDAGWPDALVNEVNRQRREVLPLDKLPERVAWRRNALARLIASRNKLLAAEDMPGDE